MNSENRTAGARIVAVGGLSGSGKSTVAALLALQLRATVLRSDVVRKEMAGVAAGQTLGPQFYTADWHARVYAEMLRRAEAAARAGDTVIVDAVFARASERDAVRATAARAGVPFDGLWLDATLEQRRARVAGRRNDASDATVKTVELQADYEIGTLDWHRVPTDGLPEVISRRSMVTLGLI